MTVVNFAHGAFYMLGAYVAFSILGLTKSFWATLVLAPLVVGTLGLLVERVLIRRLYGRSPDDPLLLTFGLSLAMVEAVKLVWGKIGLTVDPPKQLAAAVDLGFMNFPVYRSVRHRGDRARAGRALAVPREDQHRAHHPGGLARRVDGAGARRRPQPNLAARLRDRDRHGRAGRRAGGPMRGVYAEMGVEIIIECFVVVVVGGMGSLPGAIVAGLLIGEIVSLTTFFAPKLAEIVVFVVMAVGAARPAERTLRRGGSGGVMRRGVRRGSRLGERPTPSRPSSSSSPSFRFSCPTSRSRRRC